MFHPEGSSECTVTFNGNGGTPATQTKTVDKDTSIGLSDMPTAPTRSGYTFDGWYTATSGGTSFTFLTIVREDITVYARWTSSTSTQCTVTFNWNGGTPATQTRTVSSGSSIGISNMPTSPTRSGYTFGGWYYGDTQFTAYTTVTTNITVYASWTPGSVIPGTTLQSALDWLTSNAADGGNYIIS